MNDPEKTLSGIFDQALFLALARLGEKIEQAQTPKEKAEADDSIAQCIQKGILDKPGPWSSW